jgi:hypothetical protein
MNKSLDMNSLNCMLLVVVLVVVVLCCVKSKTKEGFKESKWCGKNCDTNDKCEGNVGKNKKMCKFLCRKRCAGYAASQANANACAPIRFCIDAKTAKKAYGGEYDYPGIGADAYVMGVRHGEANMGGTCACPPERNYWLDANYQDNYE